MDIHLLVGWWVEGGVSRMKMVVRTVGEQQEKEFSPLGPFLLSLRF